MPLRYALKVLVVQRSSVCCYISCSNIANMLRFFRKPISRIVCSTSVSLTFSGALRHVNYTPSVIRDQKTAFKRRQDPKRGANFDDDFLALTQDGPSGYELLQLIQAGKTDLALSHFRKHQSNMNVLRWSQMLNGLAAKNRSQEMLALFAEMKTAGVKPRLMTYNNMIAGLTKHKRKAEALKLFAEMKSLGIAPDILTYGALIDMHVKLHEIASAEKLIEELEASKLLWNTFVANCLILLYANLGDVENSLKMLQKAKSMRVALDAKSFGFCLVAFSRCKELTRAHADMVDTLYKEMDSMQIEPPPELFSVVLKTFGKLGMMKKAQEYLRIMEQRKIEPTQMVFTQLIQLFAKMGLVERVEALYKRMQDQGHKPDAHTYTALLTVFGRNDNYAQVRALWEQMRQEGIEPDATLYSTVLNHYNRTGRHMDVMRVFNEYRTTHPDSVNNVVLAPVFFSLTKDKRLETIVEILDSLGVASHSHASQSSSAQTTENKSINAISTGMEAEGWNFAIDALVQAGRAADALEVYQDLLGRDHIPAAHTLQVLIDACTKAGHAEQVEKFVQSCLEKYPASVKLHGSLLLAYSRLNKAAEARRIREHIVANKIKLEPAGFLGLLSSFVMDNDVNALEEHLSDWRTRHGLIPSHYEVILEGYAQGEKFQRCCDILDDLQRHKPPIELGGRAIHTVLSRILGSKNIAKSLTNEAERLRVRAEAIANMPDTGNTVGRQLQRATLFNDFDSLIRRLATSSTKP